MYRRWARIPREERLCVCGELQTESHVLLQCERNIEARETYLWGNRVFVNLNSLFSEMPPDKCCAFVYCALKTFEWRALLYNFYVVFILYESILCLIGQCFALSINFFFFYHIAQKSVIFLLSCTAWVSKDAFLRFRPFKQRASFARFREIVFVSMPKFAERLYDDVERFPQWFYIRICRIQFCLRWL